MELAVVGAVEVGRARLQEAELGAPAGEQLGLLAGVGDVEDLDAVHPERAGSGPRCRGLRPGRRCPRRGEPTRRRRRPRGSRRPPRPRSASARIRKAGLPSIRYPRIRAPTSPMSSVCSRSAFAGADRTAVARWGRPIGLPGGDPLPDLRFVELEPGLLERLGHPQRPLLAVGEELRQPFREPRAGCGRCCSRGCAVREGWTPRRRPRRSRPRGPPARRAAHPPRGPRGRRRWCRGRTAPAAPPRPRPRAATTSAAGRVPSEWVECDCRSKRGAIGAGA